MEPTTEVLPPNTPAAARRPRWGALAVWLILLGLLSLLGIGVVRSQQGPINVGSRIPDFTLTTFDGQTYNTADLRGQVILINFWASWCEPCEEEAAELEQAYQEYRDHGVIFLGVNYVDTEPEALAYLERFRITYPNGPDLGTEISQSFRMRGVPETYIADRQGILVSRKIGPYASVAEIRAVLEAALGTAP
jgi:cytochrome c biogenesis protein CcmG/thiol:disulfide interchange protein DsbE